MAFCLSEYVCSGEIVNTRKNSVHGFLEFRGCDRPMILQLTGNCSGALAGRHLRFEAHPKLDGPDVTVTEDDLIEMRAAWIQIGVPAEMSIEDVTSLADAPDSVSAASRDDSGYQAMYRASKLRLEWHSQNGHTIIHLDDPVIEFINPNDEKEQGRDDVELIDDDFDEDDEFDDDDTSTDMSDSPWGEAPSSESSQHVDGTVWNEPSFDEHDEADDPFGLFPQDLEARLDESTPKNGWTPEHDEETLAKWKEWDEVFEGTKDVPLSSLFDPPLKLSPADALDDQQVADQLNLVLARLALHNVAFHMCEHYTPRSAYKLLLETILPEESTHPELPRIGYTMNFDTSESCPECDAEFERRHAERQANSNPDDFDTFDDETDDDIPF